MPSAMILTQANTADAFRAMSGVTRIPDAFFCGASVYQKSLSGPGRFGSACPSPVAIKRMADRVRESKLIL
jgi:hypothetical protein